MRIASTTIGISEETKERLRQRGEKGQTYDEIIIRLIHCCDKQSKR